MDGRIDTGAWDAEQRRAYEAALSALQAEERAATEEAARARAESESPEAVIAGLRAKAEAAKAERARLARERDDERAFAEAVRGQGGEHRVARLRTPEGSVILVPMSGPAWETFSERLGELKEDGDRQRLARQTIYDTLHHPKRERFDELVNRYPLLWLHLYEARDALIDGMQRDSRGKG